MAGKPAMRGHRDAEAIGLLPQGLRPFQFTTRRLRDFIAHDHLLIRIDEQFDFAKLGLPWRTTTAQTRAGPPSTRRC